MAQPAEDKPATTEPESAGEARANGKLGGRPKKAHVTNVAYP